MTSVCISNCVNDARDPRIPVRASYVNLYKWPESDREFVRSVTSKSSRGGMGHPRVVDSISCRQMYLRSYTFSRDDDETAKEKSTKCFGGGGGGRVKEKVSGRSNNNNNNKRKEKKGSRMKKRFVLKRVKETSCNALFRIFQRLLSCGASVDVADQKD